MSAHKGAFPKRNRIIAALAPVTIVVEAGFRSGALNTASQALELGRVVAAVPGPIDSEQSRGSNQLLRDGAVLIAAADDALALLGISRQGAAPGDANLPEVERKVGRHRQRITDRFAPGITGQSIAECGCGDVARDSRVDECRSKGDRRR